VRAMVGGFEVRLREASLSLAFNALIFGESL